MLCLMDVDELKHALGGIVLEAAYLERVLRASLSALIGSKYATAINGRMMAHELIEDCHRITGAHTDVPEAAKATLTAALNACDVANKRRNRVIHDTWAYLPDQVMMTLRGERDFEDVAGPASPPAGLTDLPGQIATAAASLAAAVQDALGPDCMRIEDELRLQLGHHINAEIG
jgi:hypothetical protein